MPRTATNSLILTNLKGSFKNDPQVLAHMLASHSVRSELVYLPRFMRYIVICPSIEVSEQTKQFLEENLGNSATISFSMRNNNLLIPCDDSWALQVGPTDIEYLELPLEEGSKRFLILPPLSPQNEWDLYDKVEEGPNKKAIYSPDELAHLLWDRLGGFESSTVRKFENEIGECQDSEPNLSPVISNDVSVYDISEQKDILFQDIPNGLPAIVVDKVDNQGQGRGKIIPKTARPPKSDAE